MESEKYIIKKLNDMDDVVVTKTDTTTTQIKFVDNKIVMIHKWDDINTDIFATKNKRIYLTSLKDTSKGSIDKIIKVIKSNIKNISKNNDYYGIAKGPFKYRKITDTYDKRIEKLDEEAVDIVNDAINNAIDMGVKRASGVFEFSTNKIRLLTSNNVDVGDKGTSLYLSIRSMVTKQATGHSVAVSRVLNKFKYKKAVEHASTIANLSIDPVKIKEGKYDIIFEPMSISNLLSVTAESLSAFNVDSGLSFFINKINKNVANENVTLTDDGILPNGMATTPFDSEGVPTRKTTTINKGILKTYLHNTSTAIKYKTKTTANAGLIAPQPTNTILKKGDYKFDELFDVKKGIYITNVWYTRFKNYSTGDFSTIPRDGIFYIENGEIKYPIKNIRVSDNMLNILKNISAIGRKQKQVIGWDFTNPIITPSVRVNNIKITGPN